ncbi:MAG: hypothetical protein H0U38_08420 [Chloroflexia bacterium]|jgi:hypothetical protein|nr:hypothetical protein [Chloroflexia bacterium]MDQ3614867.1 hypothetical protein [Chloroflexota bacterium]
MRMDEFIVTGIEIDLRMNVLRLNVGAMLDDLEHVVETGCSGSVDIGAGGRLLGVDLGESYAPVMPPEPGTEAMARSAVVEVTAIRDRASRQILSIVIPRRGEGYEITYPSGNQ